MNKLVQRHPAVRWAAPAVAVALIGGSQLVGHAADAAPNLPARTPAQLVSAALSARVDGFSGTLTSSADLGLPDLSGMSSGNSEFPLELLSGTHTVKVWANSQAGARIAILGDQSERDLVVNRTDVWAWNSADRSVEHVSIPAATDPKPGHRDKTPAEAAKYTPQQAANYLLERLGTSSTISSSANVTVAGRPAYDLIITPKDAATTVGSIHLAIDAKTSMPLRVSVFARGASSPAYQLGFTTISYTVPTANMFTFTPPKGTKVNQLTPKRNAAATAPAVGHEYGKVVGTGWSSVWVGDLPTTAKSGKGDGNSMQSALKLLPRVSGSWGNGHLLTTALVNVVVTDDGRVAVGAVQPNSLYAALGSH